MRIQGTRYYCALSEFSAGRLKNGARLKLKHESDNPKDLSAISISNLSTGAKLGYAARELAPFIRSLLLRGISYECTIGTIKSSGDSIEIDCNLNFNGNIPTSSFDTTDNSPAVYAIINLANMKTYVGHTMNLRTRFSEHKKQLDVGKHFSSPMRADWLKYGTERFATAVLKRGGEEAELKGAEREAINRIGSYESINGYNDSDGWDDSGHRRSHHSRPSKDSRQYDPPRHSSFKTVRSSNKTVGEESTATFQGIGGLWFYIILILFAAFICFS